MFHSNIPLRSHDLNQAIKLDKEEDEHFEGGERVATDIDQHLATDANRLNTEQGMNTDRIMITTPDTPGTPDKLD